MANLQENDSSDDDFSENLQLAERLRLNRDNKHLGYRKKNLLEEQSSSSSSLEMQFEPLKNGTSQNYSTYNKKRQNGDKSVDLFAKPKRTCLSNRYLKSPENTNKKKSHSERTKASDFSSNSNSKFLFADKTYEDHHHNIADKDNPIFNSSKHYSKRRILNDLSDHVIEDVTCLSPVIENHKQSKESKHNKYKNSAPSTSKQLTWREPQSDNGEHSRTAKNGILKSAPYIAHSKQEFHQDSHPSVSDMNIVHYVDSASDEDSRSMVKSGSLKGGRQSPDLSPFQRKVLGRKAKKKVLDSDEASDEDWPSSNQTQNCLVFSSSDSETERDQKNTQNTVVNRKSSDYPYPLSSSGNKSNFQRSIPEAYPSTTYSNDSNFTSEPSSSLGYQYKSPRSCRSRKNSRGNTASSELSSNSFPPSRSGSNAVRGRSRAYGERLTRRSGSPHPRNLLNTHSRMTRSEASKSANRRSLTGSHSKRANVNLATIYPDLFDAEDDSNEVEFFTANSYSDTETSAESFGGLRISSTVQNIDNDDVICEHSINIGSSEDEISVVFSSGPSNNESRMESQIIRNSEPRRALGRRRQRGSWRHLHDSPHEVVSLSPDPVEQVRQVEDDERFARILQAQFDAELDHNYSPRPPPCGRPYYNFPENLMRDSDSDDNVEFNWDYHIPDSQPVLQVAQRARRGSRMNRFPIRPTTPNFFGSIFYNNRRLDRNHRRLPSNDQRNEVGTLLEATLFRNPISLHDLMYNDDSFETFLGIAELNGDVPRGLQKSEINRLPTRKYIAVNSAGSSNELPHKRAGLNKECQVCLCDYANGDTLRILPCFHEFHTPCIDPWLKINHTCPVCRVVVDLEG